MGAGAHLELCVRGGEELRSVVEHHRLAVDLRGPGRGGPATGPAGTLVVDVHSLPESVRDERLRAREPRDATANDRHAGIISTGSHAGVYPPADVDSAGRATHERTRQPDHSARQHLVKRFL